MFRALKPLIALIELIIIRSEFINKCFTAVNRLIDMTKFHGNFPIFCKVSSSIFSLFTKLNFSKFHCDFLHAFALSLKVQTNELFRKFHDVLHKLIINATNFL